MISESERVFPMKSELNINGCLKEAKVSDEFGEIVSAGEKEVVLSGVLPGGI